MSTFSSGTPPPLDVTYSTQLSYSSYNTQIVTVGSSGMVTAVAAGQTYIIVQENGSTATAALVTVRPQPPTGTPPVLTSVTPTGGIPGVTQVTVTGSGFGTTQGNGFVQLGTQNGTVSSWSDSQIVATVSGTARSAVASVNQNGLYSNTMPFTISTPVIQGISPLSWIPGMQVTITGSGFGAAAGSGGGVYFVGTGEYGTVVSWSDAQVVFTVPSGIGPGRVLVFQNGANSNSVPYTMTPPTLTSVSPTAWTPDAQVTLTGSGFGSAVGIGGVYFVGTGVYGTIVSWSDTQVVFTVPSGIGSGNVLVFQVVVQFEFPQASIRNGPVGNCGHGKTRLADRA